MAGSISNVEKYIDRMKVMETEKRPFVDMYKRLAEWFLTRKQDFDDTLTPAAFFYSDIYDNTGEHAAMIASSAYLAMIWPEAARSIVLEPVEEIRGAAGVDEYFKKITHRVRLAMDNPKAGLLTALQEHTLDGRVFGISGIAAFENDDEDDNSVPVIYDQWDIKTMLIDENAKGFVDTIYIPRKFTIRQVVEEYGVHDYVHPVVRKKYDEGKRDEKITVLKVIETRPKFDRTEKGKFSKPIRALHIDVDNKCIMREGGYDEMPVFVVRSIKAANEKYGRSDAMVAYPDVISLNVSKESRIRAAEKQLDPPLLVLDDGRVGGAVIDTSAGGTTVINTSGRANGEKAVSPLFTVGEMQSTEKLEQEWKESIMQAFHVDRLLDLNNGTQMTAYETSIRNRMRGEGLASMFQRDMVEGYIPLTERTVSIMFRKGLLGRINGGITSKVMNLWDKVMGRSPLEVPAAVVEAAAAGLDVYRVRFISPATRFMQAEKLQGVFSVADFAEKAVAAFPGISDNVDPDKVMRSVVENSGAPSEILRSEDEVAKIREVRAQKEEAAQKLQATQMAAQAARDIGQAKASFSGPQGL